jgi:hypothetical protein
MASPILSLGAEPMRELLEGLFGRLQRTRHQAPAAAKTMLGSGTPAAGIAAFSATVSPARYPKVRIPTGSSPRGVGFLIGLRHKGLAPSVPFPAPSQGRNDVKAPAGVPLDTILRGRPRRVPRSPWQLRRRPVALFASPSICTADRSQAILIRRAACKDWVVALAVSLSRVMTTSHPVRRRLDGLASMPVRAIMPAA